MNGGGRSRTVLIVEDEADLLQTLDYNLTREGYETRLAQNGDDGLAAALAEPPPDIILLDVLLPGRTGIDICRRVRSNPGTAHIPIIMVTACGEEVDRVVGFEVGADDYVLKPFSVRELILRMNALLRRSAPESSTEAEEETLTVGPLTVKPASHRAWVGDEEINLCALEFRLLSTLLRRKDRVQSRSTLLSDVWEMSGDVQTRTVDVHIKRLRAKLGAAGAAIETVRGVGYRLTEISEQAAAVAP